jgi:hypothetical protein
MDALMPCGTLGGYERHRDYGQPTCAKCRAARRRYDAARQRARREQSDLFKQVLDLIAGRCRDAGLLP